jgi:hypothetical protein
MTHITIEREKLAQVQEALEDLQRQYSIYPNSFWDWSKGRGAITFCKQALAAQPAPVQEQVLGFDVVLDESLPPNTMKFVQPAPVQPVAHCEAGPEYCQQCHLEDRSLALAAAVRYVQNNTPKLVSGEICMALTTPPAAQPAPVQEPAAWRFTGLAGFKRYVTDAQYQAFSLEVQSWYEPFKCASCTTPPASPVPDAIHHTDLSEHPQYIEGWNDCRAEMLKGMK